MGNRVVMWPRRHSIERVKRPGDWLAMGARGLGPVVNPLEVKRPAGEDASSSRAPAPAHGVEVAGAVVGARAHGLRAGELEGAARAASETDPHRGRGRPRKEEVRRR